VPHAVIAAMGITTKVCQYNLNHLSFVELELGENIRTFDAGVHSQITTVCKVATEI